MPTNIPMNCNISLGNSNCEIVSKHRDIFCTKRLHHLKIICQLTLLLKSPLKVNIIIVNVPMFLYL